MKTEPEALDTRRHAVAGRDVERRLVRKAVDERAQRQIRNHLQSNDSAFGASIVKIHALDEPIQHPVLEKKYDRYQHDRRA